MPVASRNRRLRPLLRAGSRLIVPGVTGTRALATDLLPVCPMLSPADATALLRAARSYQEAVWICEGDPGLAWLLLVSAYDLVDGPASPDGSPGLDDDGVQLSANYVARLVETCEINIPFSWMRANGVDFLSYCMEQRIDPAVQGSDVYFATRGVAALVFRESGVEPTSWNPDSVRALWVRDLYTAK